MRIIGVEDVRIILAGYEAALADAFETACGDLPDVEIHRGSILDVSCNAIVSPANSFGFMDGGIDAVYVDHFGPQVQDRVRYNILAEHDGELLVGAATIVPTDDIDIPYLIAAPTMRVPMHLPNETVNPYLATRAVLLLATKGKFTGGKYDGQSVSDHVRSIAFPGMGTGVGAVPFDVSARQIREAVVACRRSKAILPKSWAEASEDHQHLYTDKPIRLQV